MIVLLGYYNYTVWLTYVGLVSAVTGIFLAFGGDFKAATVCLLFSGLCDMFDGKIARTKKDRTEDEKSFGIQIDSLCDTVCFGVLPAVIGFSVGLNAWWQVAVCVLFVLCGTIRLGYFNVSEASRQRTTNENRKSYQGVPITTSAVLVPLIMCFRSILGNAFVYAYTALLIFLAVMYIAPVRIPKPGKWGGIIMLIAGAILFAIILIL